MSRSPIPIAIGLAALAGGCGANEPAPAWSDEEACEVEVDGKKLFVGTPECLRQLPKRRMSGVWVLGHEHSVFYEGTRSATDIRRSDSDRWLEVEPSEILPAYGLQFDAKTHAYRIEFIGTRSDAPGVYGHFGQYSRGALVLQMLTLEEIPLSRLTSAPQD